MENMKKWRIGFYFIMILCGAFNFGTYIYTTINGGNVEIYRWAITSFYIGFFIVFFIKEVNKK